MGGECFAMFRRVMRGRPGRLSSRRSRYAASRAEYRDAHALNEDSSRRTGLICHRAYRAVSCILSESLYDLGAG